MKYRRERVRASKLKRPILRDGEPENSPALRAMNKSLKEQQLHPVWAVALSMEVLAGRRRVMAALIDGDDLELDVNLVESELTGFDRKCIELVENVHRSELSPVDRWRTCQELVDLNPELPLKAIAERINTDPGNLTRLLSPTKVVARARELFECGKLTFSDTYALSRMAPDDQHQALLDKENGASRDDLERAVRRRRAASMPGDAARAVKRITIPLPSGITCVLSGSSLTLDGAIDSLTELHRRALKARKERWDISTWQKVMADEAQGGSCNG